MKLRGRRRGAEPDAVMVRSASMHDGFQPGAAAIARAGTGSAIFADRCGEEGIVVQHTGRQRQRGEGACTGGPAHDPRKIVDGIGGSRRSREGRPAKLVEKGKRVFRPGDQRQAGVIGLGAIGIVANAARAWAWRSTAMTRTSVDAAWASAHSPCTHAGRNLYRQRLHHRPRAADARHREMVNAESIAK
ncbi:MAG: hypothetical protein ACLSB9_24810 [Hydrogeniiclostridium mannosilyticum]